MVFIVLLAFLGLHLSIFVHELGHYWFGRLFKLAMPRFVVGVGPTLFGFTRGETSFEWKLIPLRGFVHILGVGGREGSDIGLIRAIDEAMADHRAQKLSRDQSADVSFLDEGIESRQLLLEPSRHFYSLSWWRQIVVLVAGPAMNLGLMLSLVWTVIFLERVLPTRFEIIYIAGARAGGVVEADDQFRIQVRAKGEKIALAVDTVTLIVRSRTGSSPTELPIDQPTLEALQNANLELADIASLCQRLAFHKEFGLSGAFGLAYCLPDVVALDGEKRSLLTTAEVLFRNGARGVLWFLASVNMTIVLINLIPIPPLDGGRIVSSLFKGVGIAMPERVMLRLTLIGGILLFFVEVSGGIYSLISWLLGHR